MLTRAMRKNLRRRGYTCVKYHGRGRCPEYTVTRLPTHPSGADRHVRVINTHWPSDIELRQCSVWERMHLEIWTIAGDCTIDVAYLHDFEIQVA